ncbi:MAG TPA: hypothetical protein VFN11_17310, partial [Ktedonobacterales bacterium]|nr:hypothetical protein [Ktedonobacterales bacterium]
DEFVHFVERTSPTVLTLLAQPAADDVRDDVIEKVKSGEVKPTYKDIKAEIAKAKADVAGADSTTG